MIDEKISIVVPIYNIEKYIKRTVESICNQTYKNLEIILVDDGSKDNSYKVMLELSKTDGRIKCIHQENSGVTSARLNGVRNATGEWIGFVDSDDTIDPDMYEHLLQNAHKYNARISHCGYKMILKNRVDCYYNTGRLVQQDNKQGLSDLLSGSFIEPGLCNKLFHNTLFHSLLHDNLMNLSIKNTEDLLMNYYLFRKSEKSVYEDFCPYNYIIRENSASTSTVNKNQLLDPIKVLTIIKNETDDKNLIKIVDKRLLAKCISNSTLKTRYNPTLIKPIKKEAIKYVRKNLCDILKDGYPVKYKIMAVWVAVWPFSYSVVHSLYSKIKGYDKNEYNA